MAITIQLNCPDHLKVIFDNLQYLAVKNDESDYARDALLLWATQAQTVWISEEPFKARAALSKIFELYPKIHFSNLLFTTPDKLPYDYFTRAVLEDTGGLEWTNGYVTEAVRVLEPCPEKKRISLVDSAGLSLDERVMLLHKVRTGREDRYEELDLVASICRQSFYHFVLEIWDELIAEPFIDNWHIKYLCDELQVVAQRVFDWKPKLYDLIINISPGSTKSTIVSIMFPAWVWTRMPSARFLGGSYVDTLAMDLSRKNRDIILCGKYRKAFTDVVLRKDQAAKSHFINTKGGSRYSFGVQGTVTGMHAHFILIDDPLNPEKAVSEVELNTANRVMSETLFTRKVNKEVTPTILIMQRLHQNDPTQHMLDTYENVKHICLPAEDSEDVKPIELRKQYHSGLMDPVRLSPDILHENFKALGEYSYAGQFLQRPVPRGGAMFKPDRITIMDIAPNEDIFLMIVRYWDKAGTQGAGCFTAGLKMAEDKKGRFWILHVIRGRWAMEERESTIKSNAKLDGKRTFVWVEQEPGSGGKDSAEYTVRNLAGYMVRSDKVGSSTGNKVTRAIPLADQINIGNVCMVKGEWNQDLLDELRYFPNSKYKDQVDAASGAFNKLTEGDIPVGAL